MHGCGAFLLRWPPHPIRHGSLEISDLIELCACDVVDGMAPCARGTDVTFSLMGDVRATVTDRFGTVRQVSISAPEAARGQEYSAAGSAAAGPPALPKESPP